jgi:hypothetical protein
MKVKELIEQLKEMPQDAEVLTTADPEGAWTVTAKAQLEKYRGIPFCLIVEGYL